MWIPESTNPVKSWQNVLAAQLQDSQQPLELLVPGSYSSLLFLLGLCQQWELLDAIPQRNGEPVSSQSQYHGLHIQRDAPPPPSFPGP